MKRKLYYIIATFFYLIANIFKYVALKIDSIGTSIIGLKLIVTFNQGENMNLSVDKPINVSLSEADQFGNIESESPDSPPVWSLGDPTLGTLVPSADGLSAVITPSGKLGVLNVSVAGSFAGVALNGTGSGQLVAGAVTQLTLNISQ